MPRCNLIGYRVGSYNSKWQLVSRLIEPPRFLMKHSTTAHALVAEGTHAVAYQSKEDYRKAARANREAIGLRPEKPDEPAAYFILGNALNASGHKVEAAQRFLEAKERYPVGSKGWARATLGNGLQHAEARGVRRGGQAGVVERRLEGLKALSARIVRAAQNHSGATSMRADAIRGLGDASPWEAGPALARRRSSRRRPRTGIGLRRCAKRRRREPCLQISRNGAAARQRPCRLQHRALRRSAMSGAEGRVRQSS